MYDHLQKLRKRVEVWTVKQCVNTILNPFHVRLIKEQANFRRHLESMVNIHLATKTENKKQ